MTRLNLGSGIYTIDGFDNLDPVLNGWRFQQGLGQYPDGSVEAISISCALCLLPEDDWPAAFAEFARVLEPGGVLRVEEEWMDNPDSPRYPNGWHESITRTTLPFVWNQMLEAGLEPVQVTGDTTTFRDGTLVQRLHAGEPRTFSIEGRKP